MSEAYLNISSRYPTVDQNGNMFYQNDESAWQHLSNLYIFSTSNIRVHGVLCSKPTRTRTWTWEIFQSYHFLQLRITSIWFEFLISSITRSQNSPRKEHQVGGWMTRSMYLTTSSSITSWPFWRDLQHARHAWHSHNSWNSQLPLQRLTVDRRERIDHCWTAYLGRLCHSIFQFKWLIFHLGARSMR